MAIYMLPSGETTTDPDLYADETVRLGDLLATVLGEGYRHTGNGTGTIHIGDRSEAADLHFPFQVALRLVRIHQLAMGNSGEI